MAYALEIRQTNGKIFATPDTPFMHLEKTQAFSYGDNTNRAQTSLGVSANLRVVVYARLNGSTAFYADAIVVNGVWHMQASCPNACSGTYYIFSNSVPSADAGWGLEMYDANGNRTFSSATKPLNNLRVDLKWNPNNADHRPSITANAPAAIPVPCQYWIQPVQGGANVQLMIGTVVAHGNTVEIGPFPSAIMPSSEGFSFSVFGGTVNYIDTSYY